MAKKPASAPPGPRPPRRRNEFGDPPDTLYAGGTPLFDEGAGRAIDKRPPGKTAPAKPEKPVRKR